MYTSDFYTPTPLWALPENTDSNRQPSGCHTAIPRIHPAFSGKSSKLLPPEVRFEGKIVHYN